MKVFVMIDKILYSARYERHVDQVEIGVFCIHAYKVKHQKARPEIVP